MMDLIKLKDFVVGPPENILEYKVIYESAS